MPCIEHSLFLKTRNYVRHISISTWKQLCTLRNENITIRKMNKIQLNYSLKNIGLPTQNQYRRSLLQKVESVTQRMRWKAYFYLNGEKRTEKCFYGLPSNKNAPPVSELKAFEDDIVKLVQNVSFRTINDPFLNTVNKDLRNITSSKNMYVFADKTKNIYEVPPPNIYI